MTRPWRGRRVGAIALGLGLYVAMAVAVACRSEESAHEPGAEGGPAMSFKLTSPAFAEGAYIPKKHTGEGDDVSPALHWAEPPAGTKSFVLVADDPDIRKTTPSGS